MAYSDFTLEIVRSKLGVTSVFGDLFSGVPAVAPPAWLLDTLARNRQVVIVNEKSRSEFIVAPVLTAVLELAQDKVSLYSGQRMDVDPARSLVGECDFMLALSPASPVLTPPMMAIIEAKKQDFELGLGQCLSQLVGMQLFNRQAGRELPMLHGCVTTGELWQFMRLSGSRVTIQKDLEPITRLDRVLGYFLSAIAASEAALSGPTAAAAAPAG
jgi:hypothetical protein